jgi:hypothetical protein
MSAATLDLIIEQGATYVREFRWLTDGVPVNLTGYTAKMQVRETAASADVLLEASTANGKIAIAADAGRVTITLSATETAALEWRSGKYDLELTSPSGTVYRLLKGYVEVSQEVTK